MGQSETESSALTAEEGFAAMQRFLEAYWIRGGKASNDIAALLSSLDMDPAQWNDWLSAIGPAQRTH